jgi:hypothetical protein
LDEDGRESDPPLQIGAIWLNVGVTGAPTFTVIVAVLAHCPAVGVNVYNVVVVLSIPGDHPPEIPSNDDVGNVKDPPVQIGATWLNVGVTGAFTVTVIVVEVAH